MIKINLLNSVTERQGGAINSVEKRVSSPTTRLAMMAIAVFVLTVALIGWDFISTSRAKTAAEAQLVEQKQKEKDLEAVIKEQKDLETKIQNIDLRIDAIKKLRNSQAGPSAVLEAIRERILTTPDIYLESVDQKGDQLTIQGSSPNETAVTQFGRSLEFSSGLFANLSIETQRKEIGSQTASANDSGPKFEVINFTIRCAYNSDKANSSNAEGATTATNMNPGASSSGGGEQSPNGEDKMPKADNNAAESKGPKIALNQDK